MSPWFISTNFRVLVTGSIRMTPFEVRSQLVAALQLDLVGPHDGLGNVAEVLPQATD